MQQPWRLIRILAAGLAFACLSLQSSLADEKLFELIRQGYNIIHKESYSEVEECNPDKPVKIGLYIFICDGYNYSYHYGEAMILGKRFNLNGRDILDVYLCLEDEDECFDGQAFRH